ncbi:DUF7167 family protein [Paenibacillus naphthalenovorans]|uniref:DUF7167 domain-containing protein n=1 Tax=Paenibacillus naphthalenovorans TaxID=162209 RepID=A0A0U2WA14_9BACL|nr:hypothetical protein [Paenibacillus naphthalenovorans]ALS22202.1 hypothetical protein IJ22_18280 [Paenibacillus naphthalenovorans]
MVKFRFSVSTGYVGSEKSEIIEIDDEDLEGRSDEERAKVIDEYFNEWIWEQLYTGIEEIEE